MEIDKINSTISCPITYELISKPIINLVENYDRNCAGIAKREVLARLVSLVAISFFQAIDFLYTLGYILTMLVALLLDKMGINCFSRERLDKFSTSTELLNLLKCFAGTAFGSLISFFAPRAVVPYCFAPDPLVLLQKNKDPNVKYSFDSLFNGFYYINLESATQKKDLLCKHLEDIGVKNHERFNGVKGMTDARYPKMLGYTDKQKQGRIGCFRSHLGVLKEAQQKYEQNKNSPFCVMIAEDDFQMLQIKEGPEILEAAMEELPKDWEMFYLGIQHSSAPERYSKHLDKITSADMNHAYAVNGPALAKLIKHLEEVLEREEILPLDVAFSELFEKGQCQGYALHSPLALQRDALISDISGNTNTQTPLLKDAMMRLHTYAIQPILDCLCLPKYRLYPFITKHLSCVIKL